MARNTLRATPIRLLTASTFLLASGAFAQAFPPGFFKSFDPAAIAPGATSTLTLVIDNVENSAPASDLTFTDLLPSGLVIATPSAASTTCTDGIVSAPAGGSTIQFSGGRIGVNESCTVTVDVTSSTPGVHANVSGDLISSLGNSGPAQADLTVDANLPLFSKSFSPSSIVAGQKSTLTFTIGNTGGSPAFSVAFTDALPGGLVIGSDTLPTNTCGGTLSAPGGSSSISFAGGFVAAASSCQIAIELVASSAGPKENVSSSLTSNIGISGKASAVLSVGADAIRKSFVDDPVPPGGTVTLEFTIANVDRTSTTTGITFTDDLDAALSGLVATGLPLSNPCGAGSQLAGTSLLTLTGGTLPPGGSCTFSVALQVPAGAAPGTYTNTTSSITMSVGGSPVTGPPAVDDLNVSAAPLLTKEFIDDPVAAAGVVTLRFTLTNGSATQAASSISFNDNLTAFVSGATPAAFLSNFCNGSGSMSSLSGLVTFFNMTLAAGASCSFDLPVSIPAGVSPGSYLNTTGPVTADVGGTVYLGGTASDTAVVVAPPRLTKSFVDDPVQPGAAATLRFTLELGMDAPGDATSIAFSDDLDAALSGLVATGLPLNDVCGAGSQITGTSLLTFSGGTLAPGATCTFDVPVLVPAGAPGGFHTNTTSGVAATMLATPVTGIAASDDLSVIGLTLAKAFTDDPAFPGGTVTLEFTLNNPSATSTATNISFTDNLDATLPGLAATGLPAADVCGAGSQISGTTTLTFVGGNLGPGTSCTFPVTLQIPVGAASGVYPNLTSVVSADIDAFPATLPAAGDTLEIATPIAISKSFLDDPAAPGGTLTLQFTIDNVHPTDSASSIGFTDDLAAALSGLAAVGLPANDVCGAGSQIDGTSLLTFTGGALAPGASCTFDVTLQVPAGALPASYTNTTSDVTAIVGAVFATGSAATDSFSIEAAPDFAKTFLDDPAPVGGTVTLRFTITNPSAAAPMSSIGFTDDLASVLPGLVTTGLPASNVCGAGSQLTGTTLITLTGGSLAGGASCTFDVVLQVPAGASPGTFPNATSAIAASVGGSPVIGSPATDALTVVASPTLTKAFLTDPVAPGGTTSLQFSISLSAASPASATSIGFTDDLSAALPGLAATGLPLADVCGAGSQISGTTVLTLTGGSLAPGATCTFAVPLQVPAVAAAGTFTNTTSALTSIVSGVALTGGPATDTISVVSGPILAKQFLADPVGAGDSVTLQFTITLAASSPGPATAITFTDDLNAALAGLVASGLPAADVCGAGSQLSGTSTLTLTNGTLAPGGSCTFSATLQVPVTATPSSVTNTTSILTANVLGSPVAGNAASDVLDIHGLTLTKTFVNDALGVGTTSIPLRFTIANANATQTTTNIAFTDDLDAAFSGLVAVGLPLSDVCGAGSQISGTSVLTFTGGSLAPGVPCSFDVTLQLPPGAGPASITNTTSAVTGTIGTTPVSGPPATDTATIGVNIPTLDPRVLLLLGALLAAIAAMKLTPRS